MEAVALTNINEIYLDCARKVIAWNQKISKMSSILPKITRRQKDLTNHEIDKYYRLINREITYMVQKRQTLSPEEQVKFDKFLADKATSLTSDNPELSFVKSLIYLIKQDETSIGSKKRK